MILETHEPGLYVLVGDRLECIAKQGASVTIIKLLKSEAAVIAKILQDMSA